MDKSLGTIEGLSESEEMEKLACEAVVDMVCSSFVQAGMALARIRDLELYRVDFDTFEAYCRAKWDYAPRQVYYLIASAQLFTQLCTFCAERKPDHEAQVRPLLGLEPEQAHQAWECAAKKAGPRRITARIVKAAMQELQLAGPPKPAKAQLRLSKAEQRRLIDEAIGQLLVLVSQKAGYDILTEKLEALHGLIQPLLENTRAAAT